MDYIIIFDQDYSIAWLMWLIAMLAGYHLLLNISSKNPPV